MKPLSEKDRPLAVMDKNYHLVHQWIAYHYGKADHCDECDGAKSQNYSWANIDGIYEKDIKHFVQLCRSCHAKMDTRDSTRKKMSATRKGIPKLVLSKRVGKFTKGGDLVEEYRSVSYAAEVNGCTHGNIFANIHGRQSHALGYVWRYL